MDEFKDLCEQFVSLTAQEPKCVYYGFSFNADHVHCREAYEDAEGLLTHLTHVGAVLNEALKISQITRLEVHADCGGSGEVEGASGQLSSRLLRSRVWNSPLKLTEI